MLSLQSPCTRHARIASSARTKSAPRCAVRVHAADGDGLRPELKSAIDRFVKENKVILFMKVNILEDNALRSGMKEYSAWPTFPQVYIDGEFFGGCDITVAAFQDGSLKEVVEKALAS